MGSVHPYKTAAGKKYYVRYRKPDGTNAAKRGFRTKLEAQTYLATVDVSISANQYIDPNAARIRIGELGKVWLEDQAAVMKPSPFHSLESSWRIHVEPAWGKVQVAAVRFSDVRAWVTELAAQRSATTTIRSYGILAGILDVAVKDRRIAENPARGVKLPRKAKKRRVYLSHDQVTLLASESSQPTLILFLAYTGLRWGEATGLRVRDVLLERRRVHVQENAVTVNGQIHVGTPKTHETRTVPYPEFLDANIRSAIGHKRAAELLFGDGQVHMRLPSSQSGWFVGAVKRARRVDPSFPELSPHDLRHTAASLAISAGANVKAVQRMLGHASAAMTLDTYADLFDDDLDNVADALSRARSRSHVRASV